MPVSRDPEPRCGDLEPLASGPGTAAAVPDGVYDVEDLRRIVAQQQQVLEAMRHQLGLVGR